MPHSIIDNLNKINKEIESESKKWQQEKVKLIAVSKKQPVNKIQDLINAGHLYFAENQIKEANEKWPNILKNNQKIKLHFIGHLQRNKTKEALKLFDIIETIDNEKLALEITKHLTESSKTKEMLIQINIGKEEQKYGIEPEIASEFIKFTINDLKLPIKGLMCIPPKDENPAPFFAFMKKIAKENNLHYLSQGMSNDYKEAIKIGTSQVRIGTNIFGLREGYTQ
ncbi:MAG: YggS family pyridoxal phosphate-dependent enzyme [Rickettsiales bacterium]|nr:YggS family pyridoxal phosphate-dependent enzyme [Rickettsiales bacterium]